MAKKKVHSGSFEFTRQVAGMTTTNKVIYALVDFPVPLICAKATLGAKSKVVVGGRTGLFQLPYPAKIDHSRKLESLHIPLVPPASVKSWKRGNELLFWGRPINYPDEVSEVFKALITFPLNGESNSAVGDDVYRSFQSWISQFEDYVEIITKQNLTIESGSEGFSNRLDLLCLDSSGKLKNACSDGAVAPIVITTSSEDVSLKRKQFQEICRYCSDARGPKLEYRVMLEAYRALWRGDNRKAIIESATAVEICLTRVIEMELSRRKVDFSDKLMSKFRMLGGRIDLALMLGIRLPKRDYKVGLLEPRNTVVHKAHFPSKFLAKEVITLVEELLDSFSQTPAEIK